MKNKIFNLEDEKKKNYKKSKKFLFFCFSFYKKNIKINIIKKKIIHKQRYIKNIKL